MLFGPAHVQVDARHFLRAMAGFERQVPYAHAEALNATGGDAVTVLQANLDEDFTIRRPWLRRGIRLKRATKTDLQAEVGSVDRFMRGQTLGGERRDSGRDEAIPIVGRGRPRTTIKTVTGRSKWPGALVARGKGAVFAGAVQTKAGLLEGVWRRLKRRGKKGAPGLRLLYRFQRSVHLEPRWKLLERVRVVVAERWADHALSAMQKAIDTAHTKG